MMVYQKLLPGLAAQRLSLQMSARMTTRRTFLRQAHAVDPNCHYCGVATILPEHCPQHSGVMASVDHAVPRSRGGGDTPANLRLACQTCNSDKGNRTEAEYLADRQEKQLR